MSSEPPHFVDLNDLSGEKNGGQIIFATDDFFAVAENLLKDEEPEWHEGEYTEFGKWMDGWETRRKRTSGHDWCIIKLGVPGTIEGIHIDTAYFIGNFAPHISIQAMKLTEGDESHLPTRKSIMGSAATTEEKNQIYALASESWQEVLPFTSLLPGTEETRHHYFEIRNDETWTHVRLNLYPDGGIARMRIYGFARKDWTNLDSEEEIDLVSLVNGGLCVGYSNAHFGHPRNIIRPGKAIGMFDGWETARRLDRNPIIEVDDNGFMKTKLKEWAVFKLGHAGTINAIEIDTSHFKGNAPDSVWIDGVYEDNALENWDKCKRWTSVLPQKKLTANHVHTFEKLNSEGPFTHVRISIAPDGGISRIRLLGCIFENSEII